MHRCWSKGCEGYLGCTVPGARDVRGIGGSDVEEVLEQEMGGVPGVNRSCGKGLRAIWGAQLQQQGIYEGYMRSCGMGCEGYMECTGPAARDVRGT